MSGVYIKGMEMPTSCFKCEFRTKIDPDNLLCLISQKTFEDRFYHIGHRDQSCPLIPVPPHGDLIDRDALIKKGWLNLHKEVMRMGGYAIHELPLKNPSIPVIIPGEEANDGNA